MINVYFREATEIENPSKPADEPAQQQNSGATTLVSEDSKVQEPKEVVAKQDVSVTCSFDV